MGSKIAAAAITLIVLIAVALVMFFFMIVAMNGFSESDASYGLIAYIVLAVVISLLMCAGSVLGVHWFAKRQFNVVGGVLLSCTAFCVMGAVLIFVSSFIGIGVAEYVRVNF